MIIIDERIEVPASTAAVWSIMSNPHQVVACVPGATLGESHDDGTFDGSLTVQFGPLKIPFRARIQLVLDEVARIGHLTAGGKDEKGGTRLQATANFRITPDATGSVIAMRGEVEIKGRLAGLVEGGANVVVRRMTDQFTERLSERCREAETVIRA